MRPGALTPLARRLMDAFWPGPLAVVVGAAASLDRRVVGEGGTIAVRVPANAVARALAGAFHYPITATSANRSGRPAPATAADAGAAFGSDIDAVIDAGPDAGRGAVDHRRRPRRGAAARARGGRAMGARATIDGVRGSGAAVLHAPARDRAALVGLCFGTRRRDAAECRAWEPQCS